MKPNVRRPAAIGWSAVVFAVLVVPAVAYRRRLPDPMATHWNLTGHPDDSSSIIAASVTMPAIWLVGCVLLLVVGRRSLRHRDVAGNGRTGALLGFVGGLLAALQVETIAANLDHSDWHAATLSPMWAVVSVLVGLGCGTLGWLLDRRTAPARRPDAADRPTMDLRPGERAVWIGRVKSPVLLLVGTASAVVGATAGLLALLAAVPRRTGSSVAVPLLIVGLAVMAVSSLSVIVDERGVRIAFGPWAWPVRRIRLGRIAAARAERLSPMQVGGWGVRGVPGRMAIMLRGGDCLILRYHSGSTLSISVDDARRGAELINTLRDRTPV